MRLLGISAFPAPQQIVRSVLGWGLLAHLRHLHCDHSRWRGRCRFHIIYWIDLLPHDFFGVGRLRFRLLLLLFLILRNLALFELLYYYKLLFLSLHAIWFVHITGGSERIWSLWVSTRWHFFWISQLLFLITVAVTKVNIVLELLIVDCQVRIQVLLNHHSFVIKVRRLDRLLELWGLDLLSNCWINLALGVTRRALAYLLYRGLNDWRSVRHGHVLK